LYRICIKVIPASHKTFLVAIQKFLSNFSPTPKCHQSLANMQPSNYRYKIQSQYSGFFTNFLCLSHAIYTFLSKSSLCRQLPSITRTSEHFLENFTCVKLCYNRPNSQSREHELHSGNITFGGHRKSYMSTDWINEGQPRLFTSVCSHIYFKSCKSTIHNQLIMSGTVGNFTNFLLLFRNCLSTYSHE
jgi:hypothetical protein